VPKRAPRRRTGHRNWRWSYITNSERGAVIARRLGEDWVDNDWHVTKYGQDWGNDHGAPLHLFFRKGDRMERHTSEEVFALKVTVNGVEYHIRTLREALEDNQRNGVGTEVEVKDWRPWATRDIIHARMAELARTALEVYGPQWRRHVNVKVLTNLGGGLRYALKVCRIAHHYGIPTILLVRGRARFMRFRNHPAITWVRGSAVIRK
jgi:hypothetical protein